MELQFANLQSSKVLIIFLNLEEIRKNEGELLILSCEIDSNNGDKNHISVPLSWYFSNGSQIGLKDKHQR